MSMRATDFEFKYRAVIFGCIIWLGFLLYTVHGENVTNWLQQRLHVPGDGFTRLILFAAAVVVGLAALIRTWASAFLNAQVVYASNIKTAALVADGPYRYVRNPLYLANVLMIIGIGSMMSRAGMAVATLIMILFSYRLIFREESELQLAQAGQYRMFFNAVPRLWPALRPRLAESGRRADWKQGFKAECWYWGFAIAIVAFALTLQLVWLFIVLGASLTLFWLLQRKMA